MWLFFSLLAPLFFAIVHVMDSYCVEDVFEKPWMGMVTSALASTIALLPLPYIMPFLDWQMPSLEIILLALLTGALIQFSQAFYFQALSYSEAGIVASYWNMVPALVPVLSFVFLRERLSLPEYIAIYVLITASVLFCLIDSSLETRWKSFGLMCISALMQAAMFLLQDFIFANTDYYLGFTLITIGLIFAGVLPLVRKSVREVFYKNRSTLVLTAKLFVAIEIVNLLALAFSQKAVDLGIPSFVAAVESTIPAYTFMLMLLLAKFAPKYGDERSHHNIVKKFGLVAVMTIAVGALA